MATEAGTLPARRDAPPGTAGAMDVDVHPAVPGMAALLPYLDAHWREQVTVRPVRSSRGHPSMPVPGRCIHRTPISSSRS